ncbi:MAG: DUF2062 domain-containing protein [Pseudomonadota bacterium]
MTFRRILRYYYLRIKNLKGNPHAIASGMAIGVFIGFTPTIPFHTVSIILIASLLKSSRLAGILAGTVVCNPLTIPFIYYACYVVGKRITSWDIILPQTYSIIEICHSGWKLMTSMLLGGLILAAISALVTYAVTFYSYKGLRARRMRRISVC